MAYLTCPWCNTPQLVADEAPGYQCFTCYGEIMFFDCPECGYVQTVSKRWTKCICGRCDQVLDLPRRWGYVAGARAIRVEGAAQTWPKL
jgi:hypothetical protein